MKYLICALFITIFFSEFLFQKIGLRFRLFAILPEIVSLMIGITVVLYFALKKTAKLQPRYLLFYGAFILHIFIGLIVNGVHPFAVLSGIRIYLKFLPFYFLPMLYDQSVEEITNQLKMLLLFAVIQFPLAFYQRFFEYTGPSGDYIAGTLGTAPMLTLYLLSTISILIGFYLKNKIGVKFFITLLIIIFLPTAINETKATFLLLPIAVLIPAFFGGGKERRLKILITILPVLFLMVVGFHYLYKIFYAGRTDVIEFYTSENLSSYMYKESEADRVRGQEGDYGRIDAIIFAYKENSGNLFRLVWGVGIGNAVKSFSKKLDGEYADEYKRLGGKATGISHFLWEIGVLGLLYIGWFLIMVFTDALNLIKRNDTIGALAIGWLGVIAIAILTLPYQNIIAKDPLVFTFLYFSGYLSAINYKAQNQVAKV